MRFHFAIDLYSSWVEFSITLRMRLVFWWQQTGTCWDRGQSLSALELGSFQEGVWSQGILVRKWQGMLGRTGGLFLLSKGWKGTEKLTRAQMQDLESGSTPRVCFLVSAAWQPQTSSEREPRFCITHVLLLGSLWTRSPPVGAAVAFTVYRTWSDS